jgi:transposase
LPDRAEFDEIALKNALFAGSHGGGGNWAVIASLVETCKLGDVDPHAYLADTLARDRRRPS